MRLREYVKHDATGLASLVRAGEVTPSELVALARQAHDKVNPKINAVIEFYEDAESVAGADGGHFHGVPFLRKDVGGAEAGRLQEMGSRLFKGNRPDTDSYYFLRAREGGLRTIGRTTTPELGMSGMSESILHGITRNPWDLERTTGGSSCGSAAAVAAGITPIAHGNDGGGSLRVPAAWCGLVGLNVSRGRISGGPKNQDASFGHTREFVLCRSVRDMAAALDVLSGPHPGDPFIITQPQRPYAQELTASTGKLKIGVARTQWGALEVDPEIRGAVDSTAALLEDMGHTVIEMERPFDPGERVAILQGRVRLGSMSLGERARAMGRKISADTLEPINLKIHEYSRISQAVEPGFFEALRSMRFRVGQAMQPYDILLTPTMPTVALRHHEGFYTTVEPTVSVQQFIEGSAAAYQYLGVFNATGHPSVSLPLAQSSTGLPIGLQIVGGFGDEATLVRIARDLEEARPWIDRRPLVHAASD